MPKVLIAVDETKGSMDVLSVYRTMIPEPETVVLIHVHARDDQSERIIRFYAKELAVSGHPVTVKTLLCEGVPADEILRAAREERVDLIVMGSSGKPLLKRFAAPCTVKLVERGATTPVLVAKKISRKKSNECCWKERENYAA
jgi:nucleotide-binding universal stress UspA family protein